MSKLKQLIGLQSSNLRVRALARALDLSVGAVSKYLRAVNDCSRSPEYAGDMAEATQRRSCGIDWTFSRRDADRKLRHHYVSH